MYKQLRNSNNEINDTMILRISDNAFIPFALGNSDYQKYIDWLSEGNIPEEPDPIVITIPKAVSAYQAKMALLQANLYYTVENMINSSNNMGLKIAWFNAIEFQRDNMLILSLGTQLGLSNNDIDQLFITAAQIK